MVFFLPLLSHNFNDQLSSNFHRFVISRYIKWEDWSLKLPKVSSVYKSEVTKDMYADGNIKSLDHNMLCVEFRGIAVNKGGLILLIQKITMMSYMYESKSKMTLLFQTQCSSLHLCQSLLDFCSHSAGMQCTQARNFIFERSKPFSLCKEYSHWNILKEHVALDRSSWS